MPYTLPHFNLTSNIWRLPDVYPGTPTLSVASQLYLWSRQIPNLSQTTGDDWAPPIALRLPALTDVQPQDTVECPAGSGRLYVVLGVEDLHKGFSNEYRVAGLLQQFQPFPLP